MHCVLAYKTESVCLQILVIPHPPKDPTSRGSLWTLPKKRTVSSLGAQCLDTALSIRGSHSVAYLTNGP
jgi:hypothetical protein